MGNENTRFKPGQSGNPKGRKKGSRNKVTKVYLELLAKEITDYGAQAIETVRKDSPDVLLKLAAALVPKDLDINHSGGVSVRVVKYTDEPDKDE